VAVKWGRKANVIILVAIGAWVAISLAANVADNVDTSSSSDTVGANDFSFDSLHTDYRLSRTGTVSKLAVAENFDAKFSQYDLNHGILRAIPRNADGRSLDLHITSVTDDAGKPIPYEAEPQGSFEVLRIGDPYEYVHGSQSYVIKYTMRDVIHSPVFSNRQEFTFDVNGTGWAQSFGTVSATLHVPSSLAGALTGEKACYQGKQGSTQKCDITRSGDGFDVSASDLGGHENVTMSVGFKPGTFRVPISWPRVFVWVVLTLALLAVLAAILLRIFKLQPPKGTGIIVPQYGPFPGIGVMEAAELLDQRDRAFPALVTQLVVSRAASMTRDDRGTEKTRDDIYSLTLHDATVLDDEDADAVHTLFGSIKQGKTVTLDPKKPKIGDRIQKLLKAAIDSAREQKLIARKTTRGSIAVLIAAPILLFATIGLGALLLITGWGAGVFYIALAAALVASVAALVLAWPREMPTEQAAPAYEHLLGIRDYLKLAEADRIKMLQSPQGAETQPAPSGEQIVKLYEKLLPYAILFGIEKEWGEVLGGYYATTPTDVTPTIGLFPSYAFASTFASSSFATTASTTSSSSWSGSSGGSSFSSSGGGGFSGGGFGGGGGGGW
jgi:uncharacterized membrane protein YgcG